jgi:hypothetical protein
LNSCKLSSRKKLCLHSQFFSPTYMNKTTQKYLKLFKKLIYILDIDVGWISIRRMRNPPTNHYDPAPGIPNNIDGDNVCCGGGVTLALLRLYIADCGAEIEGAA